MLQKQNLNINFAQGLDTKSDPFQVQPGKFLALQNSVFTKTGLLQKRNGFKQLSSLPDSSSTYTATFNGNLTAIGNSIYGYSQGSASWVNSGQIQPVTMDVLPLIKNNFNQVQSDSAICSNGLMCVGYTESTGGSIAYKYAILDSTTGQAIVSPIAIPVPTGAVSGSPRVFLLDDQYFILVFTTLILGTSHLQYICISAQNPTIATVANDIASSYIPTQALSFDCIASGVNLYIAYNTTTGGQAVNVTLLTKFRASQGLSAATALNFAGQKATIMSMCQDSTGNSPIIWASYYDSASGDGYSLAVDVNLNVILAPTKIINSVSGVLNITCAAQNQLCTTYYERSNNYSYDAAIPTHFISTVSVTQAGVVGTTSVVIRSLGLASKAFELGSSMYFLGVYFSQFQPTYFLINATTGTIAAKLAYGNAGSYLTYGLPEVNVNGSIAQVDYLFKDLIEAVNKTQGITNNAGIYSQTGVNLATFNLTKDGINSVEIGGNLNISGGFMWSYDGIKATENNFFVYPDNVEVTTTTGSGGLSAQQYFYQVIYKFTDNQGNAFRSAPSVPVSITTTTASSTNTINVPTLRLSYKTNVTIEVYRWSVGQQNYYQVTSVTNPTLNNPAVDSIQFVDTLADSAILGNSLIYTTGGVIENISPPSPEVMTLFRSRLFLVDSEDKNLLWYSKQVVEATPVEMSDLFTIFVAPTQGAQGSTGDITALSALDDKLIIFKRDAIYYLTGNGPDNTGANNDFSEPIFITATVGCINQNSIVMMPMGLMFQSDKGIWLLDRSLNTRYIGAAVEAYNTSLVFSALNIPATNQVRFTLNDDVTLMYDYYFDQWGTFNNIPAISSTLYQGLHTYINDFGQAFQENPGNYLDGSNPVLMSFQTSWFNLAGLQGYQRAYFLYMLAEFYSPHKVQIQIAYDYAPAPSQNSLIIPDNYSAPWGGDETWGQSSPWGGTPTLEQWRVFFQQQKCQAFQVYFNEIFDSSYGQPASVGLKVSGLNLVVGMKKGYVPIHAKNSVG